MPKGNVHPFNRLIPMFFQFEADFVDSLRCIPMVVRYKLDTCGVKLKLVHWHQLSQGQRQELVDMDCETPTAIDTYRTTLQTWVTQVSGSPADTLEVPEQPDWFIAQHIPAVVLSQLETTPDHGLDSDRWAALSPLQRFALIKLSRPGHENRNFRPAMIEFGLLSPQS